MKLCAVRIPCVQCALCLALQVDRAKVLSNTIKQKRKEKAGKWEVPLPKVCFSAACTLQI